MHITEGANVPIALIEEKQGQGKKNELAKDGTLKVLQASAALCYFLCCFYSLLFSFFTGRTSGGSGLLE